MLICKVWSPEQLLEFVISVMDMRLEHNRSMIATGHLWDIWTMQKKGGGLEFLGWYRKC